MASASQPIRLPGSGRMAEQISAFDWASTSLGPIDAWPRALRNVVSTVLASRQPICFWWGPDLLQIHNDDYLPLLVDRVDNALGRPFQQLWADVWEDVRPFVEEAMTGRGTWTENLPLMMVRNGAPQETFWTFSYSPLHDDEGRIAGLMNIVTETTDAVRDRKALSAEVERTTAALRAQQEAERQQRILQRELAHRMKNTLAIIQAIVAQSLRRASDLQHGARLASERIAALGRAQEIITSADLKGADIRDAVNAAIEPHCDRPGRFVINGESTRLTAQQALGLCLAVHELSTNALKYGALSTEQGQVKLDWSIADNGLFNFKWAEQGGPLVNRPEGMGFGSKLTAQIVPAYFDGEANIEYHPEGLVYALSGHLTENGRE
jgi:two-component sensor histidine kinase